MTVSGKAESSQEATVYVNELDVFVTVMLLEDSAAVLSLVCYAKKWAAPMNGKVTRCKSAVSEELRIPDVSAKASGDPLRIPGTQALGDWSRKVEQADVRGEQNPGQASGEH